MQQTISIQENKKIQERIEEKLLKAEDDIEKGKTVKATKVFEELEELYEF